MSKRRARKAHRVAQQWHASSNARAVARLVQQGNRMAMEIAEALQKVQIAMQDECNRIAKAMRNFSI